MDVYLISGPNGSGKSSVGLELLKRGYQSIETDTEPGVSGWFHTTTGQRVTQQPHYPVSQTWLNDHTWLWDKQRMLAIMSGYSGKPLFFCGDADNKQTTYDCFDKRFRLHASNVVTTKRLQGRGEGERWQDGSAELKKMRVGNNRSKLQQQQSGTIIVNSAQPVDLTTLAVLRHCHLPDFGSR